MDKSSSSLTTPFAIRPRRIATELSTRPSEAMTISGLGGGGGDPFDSLGYGPAIYS